MIQAVSTSVKGRARYKVKELYHCEELKDYLARNLSSEKIIDEITINTLTGSILILYNSGSTPETVTSLLQKILEGYKEDQQGRTDGSDSRELSVAPVEKPAASPRSWSSAGAKLHLKRILHYKEGQKVEHWHTMEPETVLASFFSSKELGLSSDSAVEQLKRYGPNTVPEPSQRSWLGILVDQFKSLPVALLGAAAGLSILTGGAADAVVILGVVAINGAIGYATESEAERTIQSLKTFVRPPADVIRNGNPEQIRAEEVVPGDILILRPGTYIPADGRLIEANNLSIDESVLTGESMPAAKSVATLARREIPVADRTNMVYMGTIVTGGQGLAVVVATGRFTEAGELQVMIGEAESPETPMERQLNRLGNQLVLISGAACGVVFGMGFLRGYGLVQMLKTSISLAVAAVPEGLPAVATTTLALGIRNMKKHRVLIRRLEAVETLGSVQTICLDKTGTITFNKMAVTEIYSGMRHIAVSNGGFLSEGEPIEPSSTEELLRLIQTGVLCNETSVAVEHGEVVLRGSPTENALIQLAINASVDVIRLRQQYPVVKVNYRSESRLFMGTIHEVADNGRLIALKGSPIEVLSMCDHHIEDGRMLPLTDDDRSRIELENERMAGNALRVLGLAYLMGSNGDSSEDNRFIWLGLIGMADPIRPGVKDLMAEFHLAGIETVMITGDQGPTAYAIGKELDLSRGEQLRILDSTHLQDIQPDVIEALSRRVHVFARVSPAHKLQIVKALQSAGKVVGMTGDGVNDGPALKAADIGIAMGRGGTDLARDVADVVLEDDNLETMIIAVRDGRAIYDNIRKSLHFLLATNFSEIMVMFLTIAGGVGSPLNAIQLLWINLISDIFPGLALAMEPPDPGVLHRPPRACNELIVKQSDFKRLTFEAATIGAGSMAAYGYGLVKYGAGGQAGTIAFQSLTLAQLIHAFSCRSEQRSIFDREKAPPNRYLNIAVGGSLAVQLSTMLIPGLRGLLGIAPIGIADGVVIGAAAVLPFLVNEATKKTI